MWNFAPNKVAREFSSKNICTESSMPSPDCSDDEVSSSASREATLECPICWESFNIVENVPYVLWCGHTLCKNCVLGLKWAVIKLPTASVQLPFIISCPWCNLLSLRLIYKGNLAFPRKNYFLLWMVERMNGDRPMSADSIHEEHRPAWPSAGNLIRGNHGVQHLSINGEHSDYSQIHTGSVGNYINTEWIQASLRKSLALFVRLTAKFPLVIIFLLIVIYVIPASAAVLVLYILVTVLFALPSFVMLYFAYPILDRLVREILT
ncbi:hypothetical protein Cni_G06536 [Canna indica]|uniref:RING-type domain-containing protein n=1 Tax=Canna indica TaxID=4628 RepID=A0AAQ3JYP7_9LILI|nr:hypothetical protein Cni_G06536 [Canna indica]